MNPVRGSAQFVVRVLEVGTAPVRGLARLGSDSLLAALLVLSGGAAQQEPDALPGAAYDYHHPCASTTATPCAGACTGW